MKIVSFKQIITLGLLKGSKAQLIAYVGKGTEVVSSITENSIKIGRYQNLRLDSGQLINKIGNRINIVPS